MLNRPNARRPLYESWLAALDWSPQPLPRNAWYALSGLHVKLGDREVSRSPLLGLALKRKFDYMYAGRSSRGSEECHGEWWASPAASRNVRPAWRGSWK
jgi:hypothetical protein